MFYCKFSMIPNRYLSGLLGAGMVLLIFSSSHAAEFSVVEAKLKKIDGVLHLSTRLGYELSDEVDEAIQNGIPVTLRLDVEILRKRDFLWAQTIIARRLRFSLRYHALSKQYLVKNLRSGEQTYYKVLSDALYNLESIADFPVVDIKLLEPGNKYVTRVRASIDIKELPVPLRFFAYFSPSWNLTSGWLTWVLPVGDV